MIDPWARTALERHAVHRARQACDRPADLWALRSAIESIQGAA
jgi:hypothetical protein